MTDHHGTGRSPLDLTPEEMRRTGYAVVDLLVGLAQQPDPVIRRATPEQMAARIPAGQPVTGLGVEAVLEHLARDVLPFASKVAHPGYFAYIPGSTTWPAALADFVTAVTNTYCGSWDEAAGVSRLELVVLDWFRQWLGMPVGTDGVLVSGGSAANLTAIAAARELRLGAMSADAVLYCGDQAHSSIGRAARVLGFRPEQVRVIPSDTEYRMRPDALATAMDADRAAGRRPLVVCAGAGATNTGAVDPLPELADLCAERGVWLHVDAAYGGFAALTGRGSQALAGIERADSVTLDPHKWLYQPMECGAVLVREPGALERAFAVLPDYLLDAQPHGPGEVNFGDRGLQLTRNARAVKVWASLTAFGVDTFRAALDRNLDLALEAERLVEEAPSLELLSPATLGIVCFRRRENLLDEAGTAAANAWLVEALEATGTAMVSSTRLHGRYAVRMCVLNHLTGPDDIRRVVDFFAATPLPDELVEAAWTTDRPSDDLAAEGGQAAGPAPLLDTLSPDGRARLLHGAYRRRVEAGRPVVSRWASDRDLYVIVGGAVTVGLGGDPVRRMGRGEFFGEIAAADWGSGFGSLRTADVVAEQDCELLVVPVERLHEVMADEPAFRAAVLEARARHLPRR